MPKNIKKTLILLLIIFLGTFLRIYKLENSFSFSGEFGDNLLDIKNAINTNTFPLIGPPTSHPWLSFGPLYIWIMIPLLLLFGFSPMVGAYFGAFIGIMVILLNYFVIKKIIDEKAAILSSFLFSVSPLWISFSRDARFFFIVTFIFYLFLYFLWQVYEKNKGFFWLGVSYSLFFHFHFSPILLFGVLIYFIFLKRKSIKPYDYFRLIIGFIIPQIPLIIYDMKRNFEMFSKLILWIPYRFAGFLGIYPKNNISINSMSQFVSSSVEFVGKTIIYENSIWIYISAFFLIVFIVNFLKYFKSKKYIFYKTFIYLSLTISLIGLFIHGDVPVHYYLPVFPITLIFISELTIETYEKNKSFLRGIIVGSILVIVSLNIKYFFDLYSKFDLIKFDKNRNFISLELQKNIAKYIVEDSKTRDYSLIRVGPDDHFEEYYSQNYKYLLWLYGKKPVENSQLIYTIYEESDNNIFDSESLEYFDGIAVVKNEK